MLGQVRPLAGEELCSTGGRDRVGDGDVRVATPGWTAERRDALDFLLDDAGIAATWVDEDVLSVPAAHEQRVLALIAFVGATDRPEGPDGSPAVVGTSFAEQTTDAEPFPGAAPGVRPSAFPVAPSPPDARRTTQPFAGFGVNLRRALRLWRFDPRLAVTALTVAMLCALGSIFTSTGTSSLAPVAWVVQVATLGFLGTIRVWYLDADDGRRMPWDEVLSTSRALWERFFRLGVYSVVLMIVPAAVAIAFSLASRVAGTLAFFVVGLLLDVALTFATVVLSFYDMKAGDAVRYSIAVTQAQWPACAVYVLLAPLAINLTFVVLPARTIDVAVMVPLQLLIAAAALALKGATVLFYADNYLRVSSHEVTPSGDEGSMSP